MLRWVGFINIEEDKLKKIKIRYMVEDENN